MTAIFRVTYSGPYGSMRHPDLIRLYEGEKTLKAGIRAHTSRGNLSRKVLKVELIASAPIDVTEAYA